MKRFVSILALFASVPLYAAQITHTDYTSAGTITASGQNANENRIYNEFNGNIDNTNIKAGTILGSNIAAGTVDTSNLTGNVTASFVPSGSVFMWTGSTNSVPSGYLYCNGQAVSRSTYATLYAVIGNSYGQGDNSTTFNLPDMRGRFVRGINDNSGNDPDAASRTACTTGGNTGDKNGSCQADQFKSHTHSITDPGHSHEAEGRLGTATFGNSGNTRTVGIFASSNNLTTNLSGTSTTGITVNSNTGGNETRPINVYMAGIIKS